MSLESNYYVEVNAYYHNMIVGNDLILIDLQYRYKGYNKPTAAGRACLLR